MRSARLHVFSETKTDIGNLNPAQLHFMEIWKAPVKVVRTVDDVVAVVNEIKLLTGAGRYVKKTPHE